MKIHDFKEYKEGFRETKFPDIPEKGKRKETRKERDMGRINSNFILLITWTLTLTLDGPNLLNNNNSNRSITK